MHVYGPAHLHGPQAINAPHGARASQPTERLESTPIRDELDISEAARLAAETQSQGIRQDRVDAIRAQIAEGTYETPEKLSLAVDRLLDQIG
jgi:negative regulator of flagellin synthesis FlgM